MADLVPQALRAGEPSSGIAFFSVEDATAPQQFRLVLRRRQREISLGVFPLDDGGVRMAAKALRKRPRYVVLRVDRRSLLERSVVLPFAAERDVDRVLGYEMDRFTPFTADDVFWTAQVERRDRTAAQLTVRLSLVPKSAAQPLISLLEAIGLAPRAISAKIEGIWHRIPCGRRERAGSRRGLILAGTACGVLATTALVMPFAVQEFSRGQVERRIQNVQPRVAAVERLRGRIAANAAGGDVMAAERARTGDLLQVLATLTDILPDDAVLSDLSLNQGKLGITGQSDSAAQLIPRLASDPLIHNPAFVAPVTRAGESRADAFVIRADYSP